MNINAPININEPDTNINGGFLDGSYFDRNGLRFSPTPARVVNQTTSGIRKLRSVDGYDDDKGHLARGVPSHRRRFE